MDMRSKINSPDYVFLALIGILVLFGLIVLASVSSAFSYEKFGSGFYIIRHQIFFGVLPGIAAFLIGLRIPYATWRKLAFPAFVAVNLALILVLIPGIGQTFGGARSWFTVGSVSFQPSELAKVGLLLYIAAWLETNFETLNVFKKGILPLALIASVPLMLIALQPDVGTLAISGAVLLFLVFVGGVRLRYLAAALAGGFLLLLILIKIAPYRVARLASFVHPELDPQGIGYHINQALLAVGSGGWFGQGFGQSRQKFRYLPEVTGDSIFPVVAEELGFIVSTALILLLVAIVWRAFRIARDAPDYFSKFLTAGVAGWFGIQSFVNIGSMLGILPLTGLPLPFISYGGTALASELLAVGIVGSISRHAK